MIKISVFHNTNCYKHKVLNRFIAKFWQECLHEWNDSKKECIKVDKTMDIDIEWDVTFFFFLNENIKKTTWTMEQNTTKLWTHEISYCEMIKIHKNEIHEKWNIISIRLQVI